ncbi:hypothetical protein KC357_g232 [Hortaea werneckii]|nr:hypothetical protein KC357_g232 [Hortaea werneckii]
MDALAMAKTIRTTQWSKGSALRVSRSRTPGRRWRRLLCASVLCCRQHLNARAPEHYKKAAVRAQRSHHLSGLELINACLQGRHIAALLATSKLMSMPATLSVCIVSVSVLGQTLPEAFHRI